jgi:class 3 adenylate cyclase/tetratricopeptide (TPR) repeat protein
MEIDFRGGPMDLGAWLKQTGFERYEAAFRDNGIDEAVLPHLTAEDLKEIGVATVGDRRKLLAAIAALASPTASGESAAPQPPPAPTKRVPEIPAERRPITVMFCDLVGSTALASRLDAEDWRSLVNAYLHEASAAVTGLGGHVLKRLGDGLMALFGYPSAQENDAERAVRAALAIHRALAAINARNSAKSMPELSARVGLETGPVVVEATGEVFGDAPNIAARVQAAADPGSVLVTRNVQLQVAGLFVVENQGARELRGISEPVQLFRIIRASGAGRRGGVRSLTPFVGRDEELGLLARRWESVRAGDGQLVLIVGEPGLGKSRLVEEFRARLAETPHSWVEWSASQLFQNTPLHPIAEWGRLRFGADTPAEQRLADLEGTLRLIGLDPIEHTPLLAPLVDIPLPPGREAAFAPEELRRRQLAALVAWVFAGARSQPIVLAFEDLQWADPTSLGLLHALAERGGPAPLFLVATSRPEFRPSWGMRSHHSAISLAPLKRGEVYQMVSEITSRHALSKNLVEGVSERTGGVPLFIEEVTRLLLEQGVVGGVQAIPATLQQSLAARLDRLGPDREVVQISAVLGREFAYPLLREVAELDEPALQASMERLADADLLFVEGAPPQSTYRFKHALIQEAAYESLLKTRRQALHRRAAEILCHKPERAAAKPELVAHHFTEAGLDDEAVEWWGKAGDQALSRSAFQEAIAHLGKAIETADRGKPVGERRAIGPDASDVRLRGKYARALILAKGVDNEETKAALERARESAASDTAAEGDIEKIRARWTQHFFRGELNIAQEVAEDALRRAEDQARVADGMLLGYLVGLTCLFRGDLRRARTLFEQVLGENASGLDTAKRAQPSSSADAITSASAYSSLAAWHLGDSAAARRLIEQAEESASRAGGVTPAAALAMRAVLEGRRSDPEATLAAADRAIAMASEGGLAIHVALGDVYKSWAIGRLGDATTGLQELQEALQRLERFGVRAGSTYFHGLAADLEAVAGNTAAALKEIDQGLAISADTGEHWTDPHLHRLRGDVLLKHDPSNPAAAENAYRTAIAIANQQGARSYVLLASLSLAKLYQSTGRPVEAHDVLAPALEGFAPTSEMPEIAEAQAQFLALAGTDEVKSNATRRERRTQLELNMATALLQGRGMLAPETRAAFERAGNIAAAIGNPMERLAILYGQWAGELSRGDVRRMKEIATSMEAVSVGDPNGQSALIAHRILGITQFFAGELTDADRNLQWASDHYDYDRDHGLAIRFATDQGVGSRNYLAFTKWLLGDMDAAFMAIGEAKRLAERVGHPPSSAAAYMVAAGLDCMRGDYARGQANAANALAFARDFDLPLWRSSAQFLLAWTRAASDGTRAAWDEAEAAMAAMSKHSPNGSEPSAAYIAAGYAALGDFDRALALVDRAMSGPAERGLRVFLPEAHRVRGEILFKRNAGDAVPAEEAFRTAIAIGREQSSRAFGLRAALALAKLYQSTGRRADAQAVLAPALEGFSPTPEMPEIAKAQALIERFS